MEKGADFREQYRKELQEFHNGNKESPIMREWERFRLLCSLEETRASQYKRMKNEKKWKAIDEVFYPFLYETARVQGGCVELKMDEETLVCQLIYEGDCLTVDHDVFTNMESFLAVVSASDDIYVSEKEGEFRIQFVFQVYDLIQIEDHSERMKEIEEKIEKLSGKSIS